MIPLFSTPRPWQDRNYRKILCVTIVTGVAVIAFECWSIGVWPAIVIAVIYFGTVPFTLRSGYVQGWYSCNKRYLEAHLRLMESLEKEFYGGPQGTVVIEGEVEGHPVQSDRGQLP